MSTRRPIQVRVKERRWTKCDVFDCHARATGIAKLCNAHHIHSKRYGDPTQQRINFTDLIPYLPIVRRVIKANNDHPALQLIFSDLNSHLASATNKANRHPYPRSIDWQGKINVELARLVSYGVDGRAIFEIIAALDLLCSDRPGMLKRYSRGHRFAVARAIIYLKPRKLHSAYVGARVYDNLGRDLSVYLAGILLALKPALQQATDYFNQRRQRQQQAQLSTALQLVKGSP